MRVLAVDDELSILELLTEALPVLGCQSVKTAASGQEALDFLDAENPEIDCFLLDIQMPVMDGIQLCEKIRATDAYRDTPIIMLTAMSEKAYVDAAFQRGATDYLTKPFDMSELTTRLRLAAQRKKAEPKQDPSKPLALAQDEAGQEAFNNVERVISLAAFENYVLQLTRARLVTSGLFAIKIPELSKLPKGTSEEEGRRLRLLLTQAISQATHYDQSMISYAEKGVFLILNKSWGAKRDESLRQSIFDIFEELSEGNMPVTPTVVVGSLVTLPAFGRSFTLSYLHKAIQRAESLCETAPEKQSFWQGRFSRKKNQQPNTREYQKMLSEVIDELDPLGESQPKGPIVPRRVSSMRPPQQLRAEV